MRKVRIIPRLDIKGPNLIKGIHLEGLRVIGNPYDFAKQYYEEGADELIYMDIVASLYNRNNLTDIVEKTAKDIFVPLTVGGGVRSPEDANKLLKVGADKIAINTAAIKNPALISELARIYGSQCVVVSIEAKKDPKTGSWEAYTDNGREHTEKDVIRWAQEAEELGAGELLITSVDNEGTGKGFDFELIETISKKVEIPIIASGGMGSNEDFIKVVNDAHADAVAIADMLHYKKTSIPSIRDFALSNTVNVRQF